MIYFTADLHLGHAKIIEYCDRPFSNIEEMDKFLIDSWNMVVSKEDTCYMLGDFTLKGIHNAVDYLYQLEGEIKIIPGSHDYGWLRAKNIQHMLPRSVEILPALYQIKLDRVWFTLCHYPMRAWHNSYRGGIHLYGHSHGRLSPLAGSLDVGVDVWNFKPISKEFVLEHVAPFMDKKDGG